MDRAELAAWLKQRLLAERAREEWIALFESSWDAFLGLEVQAVLPPAEVERLVLAYLESERLADVVRALVRAVLMPAVDEMRADHAPLGRWVPEQAREALLALAARPGAIDPAWIDVIFRERAVEAVLSDTLYRAIHDFSTIIPRLIQNHLPLGRLAKIGGGIGTRVVEEIEKLLEPEIRRFLDLGTRRALDGAARFAVEHLDDPASVDFRRNLIRFMLDQEVAFHARPFGDDVLREVDAIAARIAAHIANSPEARQRVQALLARLARTYAARPVREVLGELGVQTRPPLQPLAEALWPALRASLESPFARQWCEQLAGEILDAIGETRPPAS